MTNRHTTARVSNRGSEVTVSQHETDSPIIPVAQLEHLHQFKPEAVDWVISQTQIEAEHRRAEDRRINSFIFIERTLGQVFAFMIGASGIVGGAYVAINGQPAAGATIASLAITGLAAVFLTGRRNKQPPPK